MMESAFLSTDSMIIRKESISGKTSPLEFLAQASFDVGERPEARSKWVTTASEGKERIAVVPGHNGIAIRLHKGTGKLPHVDISKPFARKCKNRECNNLGGQLGKPRSIYCSKRCQSREQNLRQGRIKNVRSPTQKDVPGFPDKPLTPPSPNHSSSSRGSPLLMPPSSPIMSPSMGNSVTMGNPVNLAQFQLPLPVPSPSASPVMMLAPHSSSPTAHLGNPAFSSIGLSHLHMLQPSPSLLHTLPPSPLTLRLGMTPSPLPLNPSPLLGGFHGMGMGSLSNPTPPPGTFSPIPMGSSIQLVQSEVQLPKPTAKVPNVHTMPAPVRPTAVNLNKANLPAPQPRTAPTSIENLTLPPMKGEQRA